MLPTNISTCTGAREEASTDVVMKVQHRIKPGDLLLKEEPFIYVLSSKVHTEYCDNCFKKGKLLKCSSCQYVYYCGKGCQRESWTMHKDECKCIKRIAPKVIPDAARLLARLIRKMQKGGDQIKSYYTEGNFRMFKDLMSHYSDLKEDSRKIEHFVALCAVLHEFLGGVGIPNTAEMMGMYGRMLVNSFNICDAEFITLGTGIYLGASVIDHSCKPNATATFEGTTLYIRATEHMPCLDWKQVHISYVDVMNTPKTRQDELKHTYFFLCQCSKCLDPKEPIFMTAAACPNSKCDSFIDTKTIHEVEDMKCTKCGIKVSTDFLQKYHEVTEFSDMHLKNMQKMAYLDVCKFCLNRQRGVLHKYNCQYVKTLDLAFQSSIDFEQFQNAKEFGFELIDAYKIYYGDVHAMLGLLYLKIGKILIYEAKCKEAIKYLKEAYEILKVTHGVSSKLYREEFMPLWQQAKIESEIF